MIVCSKCGHTNPAQKFCGQCGNKLLTDDAIAVQSVEKQNQDITNKTNRWILGTVLFLLIWILGSFAITYLAGQAHLDDRYAGIIAFVIGLIVMVVVGLSEKSSEEDESIKN